MSLEVVEKDNETKTVPTTTVRDQVQLYQALQSCLDLPGLKFSMKVADNIEILERELLPFNKAADPSPEFLAFANKVTEEAQGDPEKIKALEATEPELVKERSAQMDAVTKLLDDPLEVKLRKIPSAELPKTLTARQYMGLKPIIY